MRSATPTKSRDLETNIIEALDTETKEKELLTTQERRAYKRFKMSGKTAKEIETYLYNTRISIFEDEVDRLSSMVGCRRGKAVLTNKGIRDKMLRESRRDGKSIVNTYNYRLISKIKSLGSITWSKALIELTDWKRGKDAFKMNQVAEWTISKTKHEAAKEFFDRNPMLSGGSAVLKGPRPAKEPSRS